MYWRLHSRGKRERTRSGSYLWFGTTRVKVVGQWRIGDRLEVNRGQIMKDVA